MPASELGHTGRPSSVPDVQKGKGSKRRLTDKSRCLVWSFWVTLSISNFKTNPYKAQLSLGIWVNLGPDNSTRKELTSAETMYWLHISNVWFSLCILLISCFWGGVSHSSSCPQNPYVAKDDREFLFFCLHLPWGRITILYHHAQLLNFSFYPFNKCLLNATVVDAWCIVMISDRVIIFIIVIIPREFKYSWGDR